MVVGLLEDLLRESRFAFLAEQVFTDLDAFEAYWVSALANNVEQNRCDLTAAMWEDVFSEEGYIPPLHLLPMAEGLGGWMKQQGHRPLLWDEWHTRLALEMHRTIMEGPSGVSPEASQRLRRAADAALSRLTAKTRSGCSVPQLQCSQWSGRPLESLSA
jgi:hypothetical protein